MSSGGGGGGGGGGLSKLGTALAIIFAISLAALFAELFYILWRRRVFRRHSGGSGDEISTNSSSESIFASVAASKELLYFLCVRSHSRDSSIASNTAINDLDSNDQSDMEVIDIDLLTIQGMFGPPRFLFTIKEEEREDMESSAEKSLCEKELKKKKINDDDGDRDRVSLEECFKAVEDPSAAAAAAVEIEVDDATPFSTPCDSPLFFTPSSSPVQEVVSVPSPEHRTAPAVAVNDAV
ncbi:hypothetical protein BUALT_Bualt11G0088900 [Buddleja alternifolia]|uniref:Uncharacterized protein n=1 Tax=Buddleja alternifolia TaxID=168488 RepID=A0AAV6X4F6_9LAMI|nr:hypothetical protein BUALT_Bualt11G0088900 [Buddleja alternifolia]